MLPEISARIEGLLGSPIASVDTLPGGCVGDVRLVRAGSGRCAVVKLDNAASGSLDLEGRMLVYLAERSALPVPCVLLGEPGLLVMDYVENDGSGGASAEIHAAEMLAELHNIQPERARDGGEGFGFIEDTLIGGLPQANAWCGSWIEFFGEYRLTNMARQAHGARRVDDDLLRRIERFVGALGDLIDEPVSPSLLHGDIWSGNVLTHAGRIAALIDPAIYYGHAEIELAFITLFSTFGPAFFERYNELRPIAPGFFEHRKDIYNLFPLLVHARLFGGSYVGQVSRTLGRYGA